MFSKSFAKELGLINGEEEEIDLTDGFEKAMGLKEVVKIEITEIVCEHKIRKNMSWPDGSHSEVCSSCLQTRLLWEQGETEWQDHKYKKLSDWYAEALDVQKRWERL